MIDKHIIDFNESLIGLRDFVELIDPFLTEKIEEHDQHVRPLVLSAILNDVLGSKEDWEEGEKEKFVELQSKIEEEIDERYEEKPEVIFEKNEAKDKEAKSFSIKIKSKDDTLNKHIKNVEKTSKHIDLLYTNSLISTLSTVEWFFSQILHFYYDNHPESAGIQKKSLTLADLKTFGSIADAEKYLIDVKIEEILRGSFESWVLLLKTELSLGLGYLDSIIDELVETYQRRNLFVHNGGVVNSIYISKVKEPFRKGISSGDKLIVDKSYLDNSICKLQKAFILIGAELWKKLYPKDTSRGDVLTDIIYENLLHSRWDIAEGLSYFIMKDAHCDPVDKVVAQLNYWLCQKEMGNFKVIENEVKKANFSDKKEIFQLGLFALQDEVSKFFEILPTALDSNQINIERLEEFPILNSIRETKEYKDFKENSKYFKETNKNVDSLTTVHKDNAAANTEQALDSAMHRP